MFEGLAFVCALWAFWTVDDNDGWWMATPWILLGVFLVGALVT